ncbi:methyl-accepting chemotaxis protein [Arenibaculum pallidiluteum]|uniref:methyl-accepting chemotaxis protein n=1 Tax=Arenibaculum pallidiluteum TaxID=2812559 RepID=UPI001A95B181|nr:HAMP domain-containing methyl-accepting chemotaxis protein [Arenibaculum pallidiluteum]
MAGVLARIGISAKIYIVVVFMAAVAAVIGLVGFIGMKTYEERVDDIQNLSQRAILGEQVNGLVFKMVMDSRGIYAADNAKSAATFVKGLQATIKLFDQRLNEWEILLPSDRKADLQELRASAKPFIESRIEIARLATEGNLAKATELGNNEAIRAVRTALGHAIEGRVQRNMEAIEAANNELRTFNARMLSIMMVVGIGGIALAILVGMLIARTGISRPVASITATMTHLAAGDSAVAIPGTERGDEIGGMAKALEVFKQNAIERDRLAAAEATERAAKERRSAAIEQLIQEFDSSVSSILRTVTSAATELDATANTMSSTAEQTNQQASNTATAARQASMNVQTVAAATDELSASINEISGQVARSTSIAGQAVSEAQQTNTRVQGLVEQAQRIGDVVQLINSIASQTNLLALNATIEAARAGEAGKGFAVVASEVKNLATQTAKATEEIASQISSMQTATSEAAVAITGIGGTIGSISEIATSIASAIEEQGAATGEIARNVQEAARGTELVTTNIAEVSHGATETGSAATQVLSAAGELARQSDMLKGEVDRFLAGIRAA